MTRLLIAALITVNLLFFIYANFIDRGPVPNDRTNQQIAADKVVIVSNDKPPPPKTIVDIPVANLVAPTSAANKDGCTIWSGLGRESAEQLEKSAQTVYLGLRVERSETRENKSFWVAIPDFATRNEAEQHDQDLKKLDLPEHRVVQAPQAGRYLISLGVFSNESGARSRLEEVRNKGVKNARITPRDARVAYSLRVSGNEEQLNIWRKTGQDAIQEGKTEDCPPPSDGR